MEISGTDIPQAVAMTTPEDCAQKKEGAQKKQIEVEAH
jgi:hypothetical protein